MLSKALKLIYLEYLPRYKLEVKQFQPFKLQALIKKSAKDAESNYKKLLNPKTCSLKLYITIWVREEVERDLATRTVQKISLDSPPTLFKAQIDYFVLMPHELQHELRKKLYNSPPDKRRSVWQGFNLPIKEIEKRFIQMAISRNEFARQKGYGSLIYMFLDKYKIPKTDYKKFVKNVNKLINYYNTQLPENGNLPAWFYSEFNLPCWICRLPRFPFSTPEEVLDYTVKKHKILDQFKSKLDIKMGDNSTVFYKKETDSFKISIDQSVNSRHKSTELIHELSHVITYLRDLRNEVNPFQKGSYQREKEASKIEFGLLKGAHPFLFQAQFGEALLLFHRIFFEIELYKKPRQDLGGLYAKIFNQCFKRGRLEKNLLYFLDERIALKPLSSLPHAIAHGIIFLRQ